ncbi:Protein LicA [Lentibacillus sp. JNUCC-1]|uniref:choline/ethanolamine kinase family protein n=1 Tax=Lentibacillus sp. JNUCC-1 TaxID=2654513 RepID=UPI0012E88CD5|nr:choline/ethanolamine kinase family protein [Lentibacillus sp. JNUCC-1]MUV36961.1 Protein LicA [Lentibacillus sp. JNUCC-1]
MSDVTVFEAVKEALQLEGATVSDIRPVGGMTNVNYAVKVDGEGFIVRLPGVGTDELVNREAERDNLIFATGLGINPELVYIDVETGMKISREIQDSTTLTDELVRDPAIMRQVVEVLHKLHKSPHAMKNRFDLRGLLTHYERLVREAAPATFQKYTRMQGRIYDLLAYYESLNVKELPCHIDTGCFNFILSGAGELYLIDWEYSGMFDPMWDVAAFMLESDFDAAEEGMFLSTYFGRTPRHEEKQRVHMHKIFQDYLWSLWTVYKETQGADHGTYAEDRFERGAGYFPNLIEGGV